MQQLQLLSLSDVTRDTRATGSRGYKRHTGIAVEIRVRERSCQILKKTTASKTQEKAQEEVYSKY